MGVFDYKFLRLLVVVQTSFKMHCNVLVLFISQQNLSALFNIKQHYYSLSARTPYFFERAP